MIFFWCVIRICISVNCWLNNIPLFIKVEIGLVCLASHRRLIVLQCFQINKRGESVEEKIKRLDAELSRYKEQIKKTRPGPAQEAVKARAMRILKQKRM